MGAHKSFVLKTFKTGVPRQKSKHVKTQALIPEVYKMRA